MATQQPPQKGGGVPEKHADGIPPNVPHGAFLVKKPKLTDLPFEGNQPSFSAGLPWKSKSVENAGERPSVILQEFGQVDSCSGVTLGNSDDTVLMDQQEGQDKDDLPLDRQSQPLEGAVNQDEQSTHENIHCLNQQKHSLDHDVPPEDGDMQIINQDGESHDLDKECFDQDNKCFVQDKESLDQDNKCFDQDKESVDQDNHDSEDNYNPFSHLELFSEDDKSDGTLAPLKTSGKKRRHKSKSRPPGGGRQKTEKIIPDSFVAVRFSSPTLKQNLEVVQQHMIEIDKKLKPTLIPLVKLHITLMTLQLNNDRTLIERARECLRQCCCKLKEIDQQEILVSVRTLQSFRHRVVYAAIEDNKAKEQLVQLAELVCATFTENGLKSTDNKATFTPHVTIAKTSRTAGKKKVKVIDPKCYEEHKDNCFGIQPINTLELLSMTQPADVQGYYHCYGKEPFSIDTTIAQDCPENVDTNMKQSTHTEEEENLKVVSSPCTAVKFIPRVLLKKQDPKNNTEKTIPTINIDKATIQET